MSRRDNRGPQANRECRTAKACRKEAMFWALWMCPSLRRFENLKPTERYVVRTLQMEVRLINEQIGCFASSNGSYYLVLLILTVHVGIQVTCQSNNHVPSHRVKITIKKILAKLDLHS